MAEVTPEIALRILETLIGKTGTPFILQRLDPENEERTIPDVHYKFTQADYDRIIKKHAPQLGGYKWDDLKNADLLSNGNEAIDFGKLAMIASECPDYDARVAKAREASNAVSFIR